MFSSLPLWFYTDYTGYIFPLRKPEAMVGIREGEQGHMSLLTDRGARPQDDM